MNLLYIQLFFFLFLISNIQCFSQVGINNDGSMPASSAMLDIKSSVKGFLPPRVALTAINLPDPISSPVNGLHVYNTDTAGTIPNNILPGDYYWNGTRWIPVSSPLGKNQGDMLYWNGTQWIVVPVGSNGQILVLSNGVPTWGLPAVQLPSVITSDASVITAISADCGGNVSDGGSNVTSRGVCWSKNPNPTLADSNITSGGGSGVFISQMTGLSENTNYYVRASATNSVGTSYGNQVNFRTLGCGIFLAIDHMITGGVAPVNKTTTYGTVTNLPGETTKCWITSNLGSDHQASVVDDSTEASAGWYWQFNRKQGYKDVGTTRTPNTDWITPISEDSDWQLANDPCSLELGYGWRIPTFTEWNNVSQIGNWTNWDGLWDSALKLHAAGFLYYNDGTLSSKGYRGSYWSTTQNSLNEAWHYTFFSGFGNMDYFDKAFGFSVRCIMD